MNLVRLILQKTRIWVAAILMARSWVGDAPWATAAPPNILFVFADDWGRFASAYAGIDGPGTLNDGVATPHFDALAKQGVLFRNAFVNAPSCTPCRSSLLSGQYFWRTGRGAILQGAFWDPSIPVFPLLLRDSGFSIGKSFKVWSPGTPANAPYGKNQYAFESAGGRFNDFSENMTKMVNAGESVTSARTKLLDEVRGNLSKFLDARQPDRPFCYWFGPTNVHRKWVRGSGKQLWGTDPERLKGKLPKFLPDVPEVREDLDDYFGEIAALDMAIGVLVEELKRRGLYSSTLIAISGDHGPPGFPHGKCNLYDFGTRVSLAVSGPGVVGGRVVDDMVSLPDLCPTFLEAGQVAIPPVMTAKSLWPVLRSEKSGQVDPHRRWILSGRERHVEIAREGNLPYPSRAIRTHEHTLIINFRPDRMPMGDTKALEIPGKEPSFDELANQTFVTLPDCDAGLTKAWLVSHRNDPQWKPYFAAYYGKRPRVELYDLKKDPDQTNNVAEDPNYAPVRQSLEKQLLEELTRSHDPRMVDEGAYYENPPLAGPLPDDVNKPNRR